MAVILVNRLLANHVSRPPVNRLLASHAKLPPLVILVRRAVIRAAIARSDRSADFSQTYQQDLQQRIVTLVVMRANRSPASRVKWLPVNRVKRLAIRAAMLPVVPVCRSMGSF